MSAITETERIEEIDISNEMSDSFLEYAYSVIYSRALPDARDGLKPVQRRILYMMGEMGLTPDKGHVKSARVVGEVMGKLHPHGDAAIYDALVRQAQPFNMRQPLVSGHGNFGSLDDGPAAARYTEVKLAQAAMKMLENIDEDVVDFGPNYDNSLLQPTVLPSAIPNLLVNGASGIAVGMATNMPPHNLGETIAAARYLLANPQATVQELLELMPAPDFPSGGVICGLEGAHQAYATGRGSIRLRAKATIENVQPRSKAIMITELPYQVGPEKVIEKIKQGVQAKKIQGVRDLHDFTDRKNGLKLVITVKTGFSPEAVLEQLYKQTPLEDTFAVNNVCLVEGEPRTLGLVELLQVFLEHRLQVVRRRCQFRLNKHENRLHLVAGLLLAIADIDEVIQIVRSSDNAETARTRLQQIFDLSPAQAEYILELRLRRLTKFSRLELETERDNLTSQIKKLREILASHELLKAVVSKELAEVSDEFATPRRTIIADAPQQAGKTGARKQQVSLQIADTPCTVLLSATGRMLRVDLPAASENPPAVSKRRTKHDALISSINTSVRGSIAALTTLGRVLRFSPVDLPHTTPESVQLASGAKTRQYFDTLQANEQVIALLSEEITDPLAMATSSGVIKRLAPGDWQKGNEFTVIALKPGDKIVAAAYAPDASELVFVTDNAQLLRYSAALVRPQGRLAAGMAGIKLADNAQVIGFNVVDAAADNLVATATGTASDPQALFGAAQAGSVKLTPLSEFPAKGRATAGVRAHKLSPQEPQLLAAWVGTAPIIANGKDGSLRKLPTELSKRDATGSVQPQNVELFGKQYEL